MKIVFWSMQSQRIYVYFMVVTQVFFLSVVSRRRNDADVI